MSSFHGLDGEYVREAVAAARESYRLYCLEGSVLDEARSVRSLAIVELHAIERDAEAFARGELPLAAVVYPARQFAQILTVWPEDDESKWQA